MYRITKIGSIKTMKDSAGNNSSMTITLHLMAPTKRGDSWSIYLGEIWLRRDGSVSFSITYINSSAWGNSAWRTPPFDYERPDVERFVLRECSSLMNDWRQMLAA